MNYFLVYPILVFVNKNYKMILGFHKSFLRLPLSMMIEEDISQYDAFHWYKLKQIKRITQKLYVLINTKWKWNFNKK